MDKEFEIIFCFQISCSLVLNQRGILAMRNKYPNRFLAAVQREFGEAHPITQAVIDDNKFEGHHLCRDVEFRLRQAEAESRLDSAWVLEQMTTRRAATVLSAVKSHLRRKKLHEEWLRLNERQIKSARKVAKLSRIRRNPK